MTIMNIRHQVKNLPPIVEGQQILKGLKELIHLELNDFIEEDTISLLLTREELEIMCQKLILKFIKK